MNKNTDPIIVIIATSFARTNLLLERSLKSVYEQTNVNPHQIYIVDDNPIKDGEQYSDEYPKIKKAIKDLRKNILKPKFDDLKRPEFKFNNYFHTTLIKNTRTKGFSGTGAWNSGAFEALSYSGGGCFLAFLDDDDEWSRDYLERLYKSVNKSEKRTINGKKRNVKIIASVAGISRIEKEHTFEMKVEKSTFTKKEFFLRNPGFQGSNIFIELKTFWIIGGFDESLKSATDRDLAIRLIEYERIRTFKEVVFIDECLVKHYANSEERVTTNSNNKTEGLNLFYRKYSHQFSKELQDKSLDRAKKLFNYTIVDNIEESKNNTPAVECNKETTVKQFNLVIGVISDNADNLKKLFESFLKLHNKHGKYLKDYIFLILENTNNEYDVRPIINYFITKKHLKIKRIDKDPNDIGSIAKNRTFLQKKVYEKGKEIFKKDCISWIIDDDNLFKFDSPNGIETPNYFKIISQKSNDGIDAMFGLSSDAPPLPFLSTLRTQLIDFYYNLTYFKHCKEEEQVDKFKNLRHTSVKQQEFYYDLSSGNFKHLEYPYYENIPKDTPEEAFKDFLEKTASLSNGVNVFRKITFELEKVGNITNKKSIYRGGNTIIFNPELLKIPNYTPEKGYNRRSDFNWAIINRDIFKQTLCEIILPLKHDRKLQKTSLVVNKEKLQADIKGLIFYRLFKRIIEEDNWENKTNHKGELKFYKKIKKDVLNKVKINNYRTQSLIYLILKILKDKKMWWFEKKYRGEINHSIQQSIFTLEVLRVELDKRKFQKILKDINNDMTIDNKFIDRVMEDIKEIKNNHTII